MLSVSPNAKISLYIISFHVVNWVMWLVGIHTLSIFFSLSVCVFSFFLRGGGGVTAIYKDSYITIHHLFGKMANYSFSIKPELIFIRTLIGTDLTKNNSEYRWRLSIQQRY